MALLTTLPDSMKEGATWSCTLAHAQSALYQSAAQVSEEQVATSLPKGWAESWLASGAEAMKRSRSLARGSNMQPARVAWVQETNRPMGGIPADAGCCYF